MNYAGRLGSALHPLPGPVVETDALVPEKFEGHSPEVAAYASVHRRETPEEEERPCFQLVTTIARAGLCLS